MVKKPKKKNGRKRLSPEERKKRVDAYRKSYRNRPAVKERQRQYLKWRDALINLGIIPRLGGFSEADPEALKNVVPFDDWQEGRPPVYELPPTRNEYNELQKTVDPRLAYVPWTREKQPAPQLADSLKPQGFTQYTPVQKPVIRAAPGKPVAKNKPMPLKS